MKNPVLKTAAAKKAIKQTVDGILEVCDRIRLAQGLTTFEEVYIYVLTLTPDEFSDLQIPKRSEVEIMEDSYEFLD